MSCLGPTYNPLPTREWNRFQNRCSGLDTNINILSTTNPVTLYQLSTYAKGNILQYKVNSSNLTKQQRYAQIAKGMWTNRTTTWATQSDQYTNANTTLLQQVNSNQTIINPNAFIPSNDSEINTINGLCPTITSVANASSLPSQPTQGASPSIPSIPPQPTQFSNNNPTLPPNVPIPANNVIIIPDGGTLVCNISQNPCSGQIIDRTYTKECYSSRDSDVPGPETLLCWNDGLQTYYPRVRRTYGTSGNKWPQGAKFIFSA